MNKGRYNPSQVYYGSSSIKVCRRIQRKYFQSRQRLSSTHCTSVAKQYASCGTTRAL